MRQPITVSPVSGGAIDPSPFRGAGSQLHVLPTSLTSEAERHLLVYLVEGAALFTAFAVDARGGGLAAVFASLLVALLLTGVLFGLTRWHALLRRTVGGVAAVALAAIVPALVGWLNLHAYQALPALFRRSNVAALWAIVAVLAVALS